METLAKEINIENAEKVLSDGYNSNLSSPVKHEQINLDLRSSNRDGPYSNSEQLS